MSMSIAKVESLIKQTVAGQSSIRSIAAYLCEIKNAYLGNLEKLNSSTKLIDPGTDTLNPALNKFKADIATASQEFQKKIKEIDKNVISKFVSYVDTYESKCESLIKAIYTSTKEANTKKLDVTSAKEKYTAIVNKIRAFKKLNTGQGADKMEAEAIKCEAEYSKKVGEYNKYVASKKDKFNEQYIVLCNLNEQRRDNIIKSVREAINTIQAGYAHIQNIYSELVNSFAQAQSQTPQAKVSNCLDCLLEEIVFIPLAFQSDSSLSKSVLLTKSTPIMTEANCMEIFCKIFNNSQTSKDEMDIVLQNIESPYIVATLEKYLKLTQIGCILSMANMDVLTKIFTFFLSNEEAKQTRNLYLVYYILGSSLKFKRLEKEELIALSEYISNHTIWRSLQTWKDLIDFIIKQRGMKDETKFISYFVRVLSLEEAKANENYCHFIVSGFIPYFINMKVRKSLVIELIQNYSIDYKFRSEQTLILMSELECTEPINSKQASNKDKLARLLSIKSTNDNKLRKNAMLSCISLSIRYLNNNEMLSLCLTSKRFYDYLILKLKKHALNSNAPKSVSWGYFMNLSSMQSNENYKQYELVCKDTKALIEIDVKRSYHNNQHVDSAILVKVLMQYSLYDPKIDYCQGMNYIAGYLAVIFQNKEDSMFKALTFIMKEAKMDQILCNNMPFLRKQFYILNVIITILFPRLAKHFRQEFVFPEVYASSWYITLFSNLIQHNAERIPPKFVLTLWNNFFRYGWIAMLKASLFLIYEAHNKILQLSFDDIVEYFCDSAKKGYFEDPNIDKRYLEFCANAKIPKLLIECLSDDFDKLTEKVVKQKYFPPSEKKEFVVTFMKVDYIVALH